ncbi:MAG: HPr(Ser) kinase/phosphatase [Clostridiales bacterium]|nr:HPr(Ser) kinase/phosphatase [Clostridiales bacterium]
MPNTQSILLQTLVKEFNLEILHKGTGYETQQVIQTSINRPGLSLVGFYDYFDSNRLQLMGKMENTYLKMMGREERLKCFRDLLSHPIPAVILARNLAPYPECLQAAEEYGRTVLRSTQETGELMSDLTTSLRSYLSPRITRHGVLVEVYGEGILLMGESGVGKSETAIELIKRGHRLIADDAVEIQRTNPKTLMGSAPELIRYYVEMRGIGVIDVRQLFGMSAIKDSQTIDMIINLEQWREGMLYDRLGLDDFWTTILDVKIPTLTIPVKPGRNLAVIIEVAAMNNRHKKMGYNAAQEFTDRINAHFSEQMAAAGEDDLET